MQNHEANLWVRIRIGMAAFAVVLSACVPEKPMIAPSDPPGVSTYERIPFGFPVSSVATQAMVALLDQLEPRFGKATEGKLDVDVRQIAADADLAAVRAYYTRSAEERHLAPMPIAARPHVWTLAFTDGKHVFAVQALTREVDPELKILPLTIVTNLPLTNPSAAS